MLLKDDARNAIDAATAFESVFGKPYARRFGTAPGAPRIGQPRPVCACCGKAYGSRAVETKQETLTGAPALYAGNLHLVEERLESWGQSSTTPKARLTRILWDGSSFVTPYKPFCTYRCALVFARSAFRAGWRPAGPSERSA